MQGKGDFLCNKIKNVAVFQRKRVETPLLNCIQEESSRIPRLTRRWNGIIASAVHGEVVLKSLKSTTWKMRADGVERGGGGSAGGGGD